MRPYELMLRAWARTAGRPSARRLNNLMLNLSLRGLGIENEGAASGEEWLISRCALRWLRGVARPLVVDGGANEGDYSAAMLAACPGATVHAFEAHPGTASRLRGRFAGTAALQVHACALGARIGVAQLWDYEGTEGTQHASLSREVIEADHGGRAVGCDVMVMTLDGLAEKLEARRIDWLKLDVEGHELDCLRGAARLIERDGLGVVQLEFNSVHRRTRTFCQDMMEALPRHRWHRLLPRGLLPLRTNDPLRTELFGLQNLVALPAGLDVS